MYVNCCVEILRTRGLLKILKYTYELYTNNNIIK